MNKILWISNNPQCKLIESCYNSLSKKCICPKEEPKQETEQMNLGGGSGSLPMYDVDELNEIVTKFNNKEMTLFDFVGRLWNKAYTLGCVDGSKGNDH